MLRVQFDHGVDCDPRTFWTGFLNPDTIAHFYIEALGFTKFAILDQTSDAMALGREVACQLPVPLARPLRALFRDGFVFVERGRFDRREGVWRFAWTPAILPSRIHFVGTMRVVEAGDQRSRRLVEIDVDARVVGLSRLIEQTADKLLRDAWERSAVELNAWIARHLWR